MISKSSYGFNTFAANRIGEIQQDIDPSEWFWTAGRLNIADWLTRGKSPGELGQSTTWQTGPAFLQLPVDDWPISCETNIENLPERYSKVALAAESKEVGTLANRIDISRFSKIRMLINTTARILNLYKRYKNQNDAMRKRKTGELTVSDLENAEKFWILEAQSVIRSAVKEGKLLRLCLRYRNGIIVVGGRAERWMQATWNKQEFILLPHNHRLSHWIAESEHAKDGHLGVSSTVAKIRSRFWIINVRKIVKSICNKCIKCRKKFKMLCSQAIKDLPEIAAVASIHKRWGRFLWAFYDQGRGTETHTREMFRIHIHQLCLPGALR